MSSNSNNKNPDCGCGGGDASFQGQQMVRPRFFAGQLLTEDDLQLLNDYVGHKHRLHNRFLFGDGVVCGLEVNCHPCGDGQVIVNAGYALDCCGNDLVLPCARTLNINDMIRDLRRDMLGGYDCGDPCPDIPKQEATADTETRTYCLYIRYHEQLTDPVMPYSTGEDCGRQICEPSRVREEIKFELRCKPTENTSHPLLKKLCQYLGDLSELATVLEKAKTLLNDDEDNNSATAVYDWLIKRIDNTTFLNDCDLRKRVCKIKPVEGGEKQVDSAELLAVFVDFLRDCLCRAVMPSCEPCNDTRVLLACLQVKNCEVTKVCNLERKFVISPVAVRYWLPPLQLLGNLTESLCCAKSAPCSNNGGAWESMLQEEITSILQSSRCGKDFDLPQDGGSLIQNLLAIICPDNNQGVENTISQDNNLQAETETQIPSTEEKTPKSTTIKKSSKVTGGTT